MDYLLIFVYEVTGRKPWSIGYSSYKRVMVKQAIYNRLSAFNAHELPAGYGFGIDERIVEYPWIFSRLKPCDLMLLDAGATLNHLEVLRNFKKPEQKLFVMTLYPEIEYWIPSLLTYVYGDLRKTPFDSGSFDAVACLSTLEHIGMDNTLLYAPKQDDAQSEKFAFLEAVKEFKRILKDGGRLYVTVPYGRYKNHAWFQIFDAEMISRTKEVFAPSTVDERYFRYSNRQWNTAQQESCEECQYFDVHHEKSREDGLAAAESIACLELVK